MTMKRLVREIVEDSQLISQQQKKCFDFNYLCDRCKLPEESVSVLIKYMALAKKQYDGLKGMVIHIHEKIAENMKRLAEEAVENSKMISEQNVYADGLSISDTLREKANAFERHFEEYLPLARIYNEKLTDLADENQALIRQFKKGLAIAESPEKNEEAEVSTR
ncbi:unnamed protein product, partial [Mesorhabditis spiculigera]